MGHQIKLVILKLFFMNFFSLHQSAEQIKQPNQLKILMNLLADAFTNIE